MTTNYDPEFFRKYQEMTQSIQEVSEVYAQFRQNNLFASPVGYFHTDAYEVLIGERFQKWAEDGRRSPVEMTTKTIGAIVGELSREGKIELLDERLYRVPAAPVTEPEPRRPVKSDYEDFMVYVNGAGVINHARKNSLEAQFVKDTKQYEKDLENWKGRAEVLREAQERDKPGYPCKPIPLALVDSPDEKAVLAAVLPEHSDKVRIYLQNAEAIRASRRGNQFATTKRG